MRKHSEILSQKIAPSTVISILDQSPSPLATHITIPAGASTLSSVPNSSVSSIFNKSLESLETNNAPTSSPNEFQDQKTNKKELNFGAPQIDLSLPTGTLAKNAIHEFNPKHFRDKDIAFKSTLALAARQIKSTNSKPIFCFLTEDQTNLIKWLSSKEIAKFGLSQHNLVIITAKHSDDLLWAMEETLHTSKAIALVAHFTLLSNLSAQRLSFASKDTQTPCLLVCNHKIDGPNHCKSKWSISSPTNESENNSNDQIDMPESHTVELSLIQTEDSFTSANWNVSWQPERGRFVTNLKATTTHQTSSIH